MCFRRLKSPFNEKVWGNVTFKGTDIILVGGMSHDWIVKVGNQYTKTEYTHVYPNSDLFKEILAATNELSLKEIRKLRHHMTPRIWMCDGVFECIEWKILNKEPEPKKSKLLPPEICYACMLEGNIYIPKQLKIDGKGKCRCCGNDNINLHLTRRGWPVDLRHKGFGFTVIATGRNWAINKDYYRLHFDMSIYCDYDGKLASNKL